MLRLELPGRRPRGETKGRFLDVVEEEVKLVGEREGDAAKRVWMEADDWLPLPLKGTAKRKRLTGTAYCVTDKVKYSESKVKFCITRCTFSHQEKLHCSNNRFFKKSWYCYFNKSG